MQKWAVCVPKLPWVFRLTFLVEEILIALRLREVQNVPLSLVQFIISISSFANETFPQTVFLTNSFASLFIHKGNLISPYADLFQRCMLTKNVFV